MAQIEDGAQPNVIALLNGMSTLAKKVADADERMIVRELDRVLEKEDIKQESDKILIYLVIESALAYACRTPTKEEIINMLEGLDVEPDLRLLDMVHPFGHKNQIAYLNAIYNIVGINLTGVKIEMNIDNIVKLVRAIDITPDIKTIEYTLDVFKDFENANNKEDERQKVVDDRTKALYFTIHQLSKATYSIVDTELKRSFNMLTILEFIKRGIASYIVAVGLLAYSGRDLDNDAVSKILGAYGIEPDPALLSELHNMRFKNHIVYLIIIYLLQAANKEISIDRILDTAKSLYIEPDIMLAQRALEFFEKSR